MEKQDAPVIVTDEMLETWSLIADAEAMRPLVERLGRTNWTMIVRSLIAEIRVLKSTSPD